MNIINLKDKKLVPIWDKVQKGRRLSFADGLVLFRSDDLISLGRMAGAAQYRANGDAVYFAVSQKIEPSNICSLGCQLCDVSVRAGDPQARDRNIEEIVAAIQPGIRAVQITGSLNQHRRWNYYPDIIRRIKEKFPHMGVNAYTAIEIDFFHKRFKIPIKDILRQLREAGLETMPGDGAEVFSERVRRKLFPKKIGASSWLQIHATAHRMGIVTNAAMLYGHIETHEERLRSLMMLREAQDRTHGFLSFALLPVRPGSKTIKSTAHVASAVDDLKTFAISRLMLDNFAHIKASATFPVEDVAAAALNFGVNDLEGTVEEKKTAPEAAASSPLTLARDRLIRIIRDAGKIPVERDAAYHPRDIHTDQVVGKISSLSASPFYHHFEKGRFKLLPVEPEHLGMLSLKGKIAAGPFSLVDYLTQEDTLELTGYCVAAQRKAKSAMLFSRKKWQELNDKDIGIEDDNATSTHLLRVLLEKKYGLTARLVPLSGSPQDNGGLAAVLLTGDEAVRSKKNGLPGFTQVFDLTAEWYGWQRLPFVFAVWAAKKSLASHDKSALRDILQKALARGKRDLSPFVALRGQDIGLTPRETRNYLEGYTFRLGKQELKAIGIFRKMIAGF